MSSDTFYVTIQAIEGDTVELQCETSTAGGINDFACSRSFVLSVLYDALPYRGELPLQQALSALGTVALWEESFHREHVDKFIESVQLIARSGIVDDEGAWSRGRSEADDDEAARAYPLHRFVLRARVTDPRWLTGIEVGAHFGTTSFDAWWKDPATPTREQIAAVSARATHWSPPEQSEEEQHESLGEIVARKAAAKKTAKASANKKTAKVSANKKTAAKKTTSKSATKTSANKKTAKKTATKGTAKKTATKKAAAKKAANKKTASKTATQKTAAKKPANKKTANKKTAAKKTANKKTANKKTAAKRSPAKTTSKKAARANATAKTTTRKQTASRSAN